MKLINLGLVLGVGLYAHSIASYSKFVDVPIHKTEFIRVKVPREIPKPVLREIPTPREYCPRSEGCPLIEGVCIGCIRQEKNG